MDEDLKKACAKAALKLIKNGDIVGLGGGSTISYLIGYIKADPKLNVRVVTPSTKTRMLCLQEGIEVLPTYSLARIDIAFDGCDEVDGNLNALKSGGGIHTKEKLIGTMADDYILLVDESKLVDSLTFTHPVVLEILEDALGYVDVLVRELGGIPKMRTSSAKDGFTITENGNPLMDVKFEKVDDIEALETILNNIRGVIDTSLFVDVATKALVAFADGVRMISKSDDFGQNEKKDGE